MRLKDKVAIVTGGSRFIGYATVEAFLREGATVILTASSPESAQKAVDRLKEKYPESTIAGISPNLADFESVRSAFVEATENMDAWTFWSTTPVFLNPLHLQNIQKKCLIKSWT